MRPFLRQASSAIRVLGGCFAVAGAMAQEIAIPAFLDCVADWTLGQMQIYWKHPIDLDGDGTHEFTMASMRRIGAGGSPPYDYTMTDWTTALFASTNVQMYLGPAPQGCRTAAPAAVLTEGTLIPANPPADSQWQWRSPWDYPALKGVGFGHSIRGQSYSNYPNSGGGWANGYLKTTLGYFVTNITVGFRIRTADAYRTGWVRLVTYPDPRAPQQAEKVRIADYAVHPQPGKDLIAGEHVGPLLSLSTAGNTAMISWSTNATNAVLEQKLTLSDPAWVAVPGVTNNAVTIARWSSSAFFRLRGQ
jgi:hypothetical protein